MSVAIRSLLGVVLVVTFLASAGCAATNAGVIEKAPQSFSVADISVDLVELREMSEELLRKRQRKLASVFSELLSEARYAVDRRQHRVAYLKYRSVRSMLNSSIVILTEVKRRKKSVLDRVKFARRIDKIQHQVSEVKKMIGLLHFSGRS
ncbi:MAG TPA: hypothetical protein EYN66_13475 [Myxococcales bacterium]|nr:hypothetical protein [Myxococcales bacterium]